MVPAGSTCRSLGNRVTLNSPDSQSVKIRQRGSLPFPSRLVKGECDPMSEIEEPDPPKPVARARSNRCPVSGRRNQTSPMTRARPQRARISLPKARPKASDAAPSKSSSKATAPRTSPRRRKRRNRAAGGEKSDKKKVLVEETPSLDTYESRRRARHPDGWIVGDLRDPAPLDRLSHVSCTTRARSTSLSTSPRSAQQGGPEPKRSKDGEARFMFNRAQELNKNGQADQAIAMLNKVVKVYKDTPTAGEAKAALDRSAKNLPLFAPGRSSSLNPRSLIRRRARRRRRRSSRRRPMRARPPRVRPRSCCRPTPPRWSWFHRRPGTQPSPAAPRSPPGRFRRGFRPIFRPEFTSRAGRW